jgi:hypothetical protein
MIGHGVSALAAGSRRYFNILSAVGGKAGFRSPNSPRIFLKASRSATPKPAAAAQFLTMC